MRWECTFTFLQQLRHIISGQNEKGALCIYYLKVQSVKFEMKLEKTSKALSRVDLPKSYTVNLQYLHRVQDCDHLFACCNLFLRQWDKIL